MESSTPDPTAATPEAAAEPVVTPEAVPAREPVVTPEAAPAPEAAVTPEPVATPEPEATPEPAVMPEAPSAPEAAVTPEPAPPVAPVPSLSLDETMAVEPSAPDLEAVASEPSAGQTDAPSVDFDLWDSGSYASTLAQEGYGQPTPSAPAPSAPEPPASSYQQPAGAAGYPPATPSAQTTPYAQSTPYAQPNPYAEPGPYQASPYQQANAYQQNPYAEPNPYAPVPYGAAPSGALTPDQERTWASAAHWSALVASLIGLGFLGPLLVYLIQGPKSAWVKAQAAESLNFEITFIISMIASVILMLVGVGFVTAVAFPIIWLVFRIIATVATAQGRDYRYPINIRMVK
jgi:uncharacterized Tic20 family protein